MNILNAQAQLFMVAAVCFLIGMACLWLALGFWAWSIDKACRILGVHGAIISWILRKENRNAWWNRTTVWYDRTFRDKGRL